MSAMPRKPGDIRTALRQVIERREGMRLAAAELCNQCQHRRRVGGLAGQAPQHHAGVVFQARG